MSQDTAFRSKFRFWRVAAVALGLFGVSCSDLVDARQEEATKNPTLNALSGPVVLSPNVIKGAIRFDNVNPEILAILQTEGMDTIAASAHSPLGYSASTNLSAPGNNLGGSYQLSAEASGGVGSVTYSVSATAWVNQGARSGAPGLGSGQYWFQPRTATLEPVEVQPDGVTLNFTETVGVVRIRFGTDSTCATPVPINSANVWTDRGFTYLNHSYQPGYSMGYHLMPGGTSVTATINTILGTSEEWDTITFRSIVEFHAGPDEIQDVCIPLPTGGGSSLGAIETPFQVFGHTLRPRSYIWAWDGPQGNRRITYANGTAPVDQPSTWLRLPHLVPGDYALRSAGLLDLGDQQVQFTTQLGAPPQSSRTTVIAGQTVDAKQSFPDGEYYPLVSHPGHFEGSVLLYDPHVESHPAAHSSLSSLSFHTQVPRPDLPGGTLRGPVGGTHLLAHVGYGSSRTSFPGRFQAAQGRLASTYSLPVVAIYDQPESWPTPMLNLMFASEPRTFINGALTDIHHDYEYQYYYAHPDMAPPATYRAGYLYLLPVAPEVMVRPGESHTQDHHYCFNEIQLQYHSSSGAFVNPVASVTGRFDGTDFEGNTVHYTGQSTAYGTPAVGFYQSSDVFLAGRATQGLVSFALPQGSWHVAAGATFVNADGTFSSGNFPGVDLTVGCGQRLEPLPGLAVSISIQPACQSGNAATITGSVGSGDAPVDHIWYKLNEQLFELCTSDCPKDFSFSVPQAYAGAAVTVYASSPLMQGVASASDTVPECPPEESECIEVRLSDYNLFLLGDYSGGQDVQGRLAAGGNVTLTDFSVGTALPDNDIANTLVVGNTLNLSRGGVWGDAWYGNSYIADESVVFPRGSVSQGSPVDFSARGSELRALSSRLAGLPANGLTTIESWGGIMLLGTDPEVNVFEVDASAFSGAVLLSISAPADSLAVINITGSSATFTGFGHMFSGGIDQQGVLFNFVNASAIDAHGYGFWGTVLAPYAHVTFNDGSFDGGIYALSMTGNAEGHINALDERDICP
jgi:choice-of-anchor A domain-containing protein